MTCLELAAEACGRNARAEMIGARNAFPRDEREDNSKLSQGEGWRGFNQPVASRALPAGVAFLNVSRDRKETRLVEFRGIVSRINVHAASHNCSTEERFAI